MVKTAYVAITGRVQGVGFRAWTERQARQFGLAGWVRNRSSGAVEAAFRGPDEAVDRMIAACWSGPPGARVEGVETVAGVELVEDGRFRVLPTL